MGWDIKIETDVVRGQWDDRYDACVWHEFYYIVAKRGRKAYLYHWRFRLWGLAEEHLGRILADKDFRPLGEKWSVVRDGRALEESRGMLEVLRKRCEEY